MTNLEVGDRVQVTAGIGFGGGDSPWTGKFGKVVKLLKTARAVMLRLDDDDEPIHFFTRELTKCNTDGLDLRKVEQE